MSAIDSSPSKELLVLAINFTTTSASHATPMTEDEEKNSYESNNALEKCVLQSKLPVISNVAYHPQVQIPRKMRRYKCSTCRHKFKTYHARMQHEVSEHESAACRYCDHAFKTLFSREQHEEAVHRSKACSFCFLTYASMHQHEMHERSAHPHGY